MCRLSINCPKARCSWAICPCIATKRAEVNLTAKGKSINCSCSPKATWSWAVKSNCGGSDQRRASTLLLSSLPSGTLSCNKLGISNNKALNSLCISSKSLSALVKRVLMASTSAIMALASSLFCLAMPMVRDFSLRCARSFSHSLCTSLRRFSKALMVAVSRE